MGRPRINLEETPARFPAGTLKRLDSLLQEGERRANFIRLAVQREMERRRRPNYRRGRLNSPQA
jgi:hypothetical protein